MWPKKITWLFLSDYLSRTRDHHKIIITVLGVIFFTALFSLSKSDDTYIKASI